MKKLNYICHTNDKISITNPSNTHIMLYTVKDYRNEFHPDKSIRTVHRIIKSGILQRGHKRIITSKCIFVETCPCNNYENYILAVRDYCRKMKFPVNLELSTEVGIKRDVESIKFLNEILGY